MARGFDDSSQQYLTVSSVPVANVPLSMSCWVMKTNDGDDDTCVCLSDGTGDNAFYIGLNNESGANQYVRARTSGQTAQATAEYSLNEWFHAAGVFAAADSRSAYYNGGNKGTDTDSDAQSDVTQTDLGRHPGFGLYLDGLLAEVGVWNAALTDAEVAILGLGRSPLTVRPQSLVMYVPLIRDNDQDIVGGLSFTPINSPTIVAHPPVLYPAPPLFTVPAAAAADAMPMAFHYYQTMRA